MVLLLPLSVSVMYGQETDFSKAAQAAIRRGDYAEASKQLLAHKNTLKTVYRKSENDKDVLLAEKKLGKIKECAVLKESSENSSDKGETLLERYRKYDVAAALNSQDAYDHMCSDYQEGLRYLNVAVRNLQQICGTFNEDGSSRSKMQQINAEVENLAAPEELLKAALFKNPTEDNLGNYLARVKADYATRTAYYHDFNAWQACVSSRDEYAAAKSYLADGQNTLFRRDAQRVVDEHDDAVLWGKVDKHSLASITAYLGRGTSYEKFHEAEAMRLKKDLEGKAADDRLWANVNQSDVKSLKRYISSKVNFKKNHLAEAEILVKKANEKYAWSKVDKSSVESIAAYLVSTRESGYRQDGEKLIDDILWKNVDHGDYKSVYGYMNTYPEYQKYHKEEARKEYLRLYDAYCWSLVDRNNAATIRKYLDAYDGNLQKSHLAEAHAYLDILEARKVWERYKDPQKTYALLAKARQRVSLSVEDQALYSEVGETVVYNAFIASKSYEDAKSYQEQYPDGRYSAQIQDWLARYDSAIHKAEGVFVRTRRRTGVLLQTGTYDEYRGRMAVTSVYTPTPEGFLYQVRRDKRQAIRETGGHRFRIGAGIGVGLDPDREPVMVVTGELRYGNVINHVNFTAGVNYYWHPSSDSDDSGNYLDDERAVSVYAGPLFHIGKFGRSATSPRLFVSTAVEYNFDEQNIGPRIGAGLTFGKKCELGVFYSRTFGNVFSVDLRFNF